jgi:hypothetical protein
MIYAAVNKSTVVQMKYIAGVLLLKVYNNNWNEMHQSYNFVVRLPVLLAKLLPLSLTIFTLEQAGP